ncbi:MAG TPA: electron transfer flavoprotein subunit beta/FixA family protein [Dehalococcoidia bacterium]|nr:electron transfer flavoprotein subunit beta/FixA family protein [Dehalococcoidia bacterium]
MKIIVCIKQVPDPTVVKFNIEIGALDNVRYILDPVDEVAVSEAIKIRERDGGKVTAISLGPPRVEEALRTCLKMGVDEAIHLCDEAFDNLDVYSTSIVLAKFIAMSQYDLILCGRESVDEGTGFLGAGIAEWLNLPLVTAVTRLDIFADTKTARVHRRLKGGDREILECQLPAVFTVESVLRKPVYPPLKTILAGLKRGVTKVDAKSLGLDMRSIEPAIARVGISQPKPRLKKTATIDSKLSAHERMKLLMSGGTQQKGSKTIEKAPPQAAAELIQFLIANGIISKQ